MPRCRGQGRRRSFFRRLHERWFASVPQHELYEDGMGIKHVGMNGGERFDGPPPATACCGRGEENRIELGGILLRSESGGAVACIGCNTGSQLSAMTLMEGFVRDASCTDGSPLTAAASWRGATRYYVEKERMSELKPIESWYPAGMFFQGMQFMFFGDPTVAM